MDPLALEVLLQDTASYKLLDFGAPLAYPTLCPAYTVEKLSMWEHTTEDKFEIVVVRAAYMAKARLEGTLYHLTNDELLILDNHRGNGVNCDRKLLPIYIPLVNEKEDMTRVMAWVYIGRKDHWIDRIDYGANVPSIPTFKQSERVPDCNPLLHNRFCFLPTPYDYGRVGTMTEKMRKHVAKRNRSEIRRLCFTKIRKKVSNFVSDE